MLTKQLLLTAMIQSTLLGAALAPAAHAQNTPAAAAPAGASTQPQAGVHRPAGLWIDVRTPEEYAQGHLENTLNIPLQVITQHIANVAPDKNAPIHLYCRSGNRSGIAAEELRRMGYTQVTNQGGYEDLLRRSLR